MGIDALKKGIDILHMNDLHLTIMQFKIFFFDYDDY